MTDIMKWKVMQLQFQWCKPKLMLYAETVKDGYSHNGLNIRAALLLTVWRWFHIFNYLSMHKTVSSHTV